MYYRINTPRVAHERIEGEVIAIDFDTGSYYSLNGTGASLWSALLHGATIEQLVNTVAQTYTGSRDEMDATIRNFIAQLESEGLIVAEAFANSAINSAVPSNGVHPAQDVQATAVTPFTPPILEIYTDMQELLLLDPIHEVNDQGWPARK